MASNSPSVIAQKASAAYKAGLARMDAQKALQDLESAKETTNSVRDLVELRKNDLSDAQVELEEAQAHEQQTQARLEQAKKRRIDETSKADDLAKREREDTSLLSSSLDIMGLYRDKQYEEDSNNYPGSEDQCRDTIQQIRSLVQAGKIEEARASESTLVAWINSDEDDDGENPPASLPDPYILGKPGHVAQSAIFVRPYSLCSEEEFESTLEYARVNPDQWCRSRMDFQAQLAFASSMTGYAHKLRKDTPNDKINLEILNEIRCFASVLERAAEERATEDEFDIDDDHEDSDNENLELLWSSVEEAVREHQELKQRCNKLQLELPSDRSAAIVRSIRKLTLPFPAKPPWNLRQDLHELWSSLNSKSNLLVFL